MTDGCCSAPRLSVFGCFERGVATRRTSPLPIRGPVIEGPSGLWASFSIEMEGNRLDALRFESASCTTLIAYCQALVETLPGHCLHDCSVNAEALADTLSGVPPMQRNRAAIAAGALEAALERVLEIESPSIRQEAQGRST